MHLATVSFPCGSALGEILQWFNPAADQEITAE
jgi:hypothetical protein